MFFFVEFDSIQDVCWFDDLLFDQGEWVMEIKEVDWCVVIVQSMLLLQNYMKDLWLVVWLVEVLLKECGFVGLCEGYELIVGLCEQFWEYIYLLFEVDDLEVCMGSMVWFVM